MARTVRWVGRIAAFGALALLLSACLKLDMDLEVSADDTVSGTVIFGVQKELLELTGGSIEDVIGTDSPLPEDVEGVTVEDYEDDEFAGQQFTFDAVPLEQFNTGDSEEELRIVREGDTFVVSGVLDLSTGVTGTTGLDPEQFLQGAELRVRITFPGEVISSNGQIDGNTVTWEPEVGERLELQATASAVGGGDGDSNLTMWLIIGGAVVLVAIVIGVILAQRRKGSASATAGAPPEATMAPPPSAEPTPPPSAAPTPPPSAEPAPPPPPAGPEAPPPPPPGPTQP
jgi:hypothetical protein